MEHLNQPAIHGASLKDPPLVALQHKRRKHTGTESTSINADAVAAVHHVVENGLAMLRFLENRLHR